jgi:methyltransferase (TIGR00027 family)
MSASPVSSVSDTARWVAVYRAWESARPDALFRDPYADRLAGEQGRAIAALMPREARNGWPIIARTRLIDDCVQAAIAQGCDCVVNLAAGLDTRPYRLDLPASLRWVEADLPPMIREKERALADAQPRCRLERIGVDLSDGAARDAALKEAIGPARQALVIAEGLLVYLDEAQVRELSADLLARPGIRAWVLDVASPELLRMMARTIGRHLERAPMKFGLARGVGFFEEQGWSVEAVHSILRSARRFGRLPWMLRLFALLPDPDPRKLGRARWSAVVQLGRGRAAG